MSKEEDKRFIQCKACKETIYIDDVEENLWSCPKCGNYFRISARHRIGITADKGTFREFDILTYSKDPLKFVDLKPYNQRLSAAMEKTGNRESVICGLCKIYNEPAVLVALDFGFLGGSMGYATGEKIVKATEKAITKKVGFVVVSSSGGARMQEGILSLMQMARTSAALNKLSQKGLPYISVLADPTTGGVTASFAMSGDIIIAEPKALIGFAGPRVIEQTIGRNLPDGFQRAEFLLEHGMVDMIVERKDIPETVGKLLRYFNKNVVY
jgi:acetyl-CoA carboxylase carboxyl transferase subunit beta